MSHSRERRAVLRSLVAGGAVLSTSSGAARRSWAVSGSAVCPALPPETAGPFPADGSHLHDGGPGPRGSGPDRRPGPPPPPGPDRHGTAPEIPNILSAPGIVRQDIRGSFEVSSTVAAGVPLRVQLTLLDINRGCEPLANSPIYLWSCNRDGDYSLYGRGIEHENYLRGVQFTDGEGRVAFQTIFPACYSGRYPHLHLEIFKPSARALDATTRILTTQLTAPREICSRVYEGAPGYTRSVAQFKGLSPADDMVFASSSTAELALQTMSMTGDLSAGFAGRVRIGIRA